ncbi:MAG: SiaB family protein kinase [Spirochaetota bacterium]|nr:SiaB family protein kinase [Spirochaetota bacterium]
MLTTQLYEFMQQLNNLKILFCYAGPISQGIVEELGRNIKDQLKSESTPNLTQKVFSVYVEQIQNILNYSTQKQSQNEDSEFKSGITIIGRSNSDQYFVMAGNLVDANQKQILIQLLNKLKTMTKEELKDYFLEKRKKDKLLNEKQGAGLGLIDIARKASEPLECHFKDIDSNYSFFSIKAIIKN